MAKSKSKKTIVSAEDIRRDLIKQVTENQKVAHDKKSEAQSYAPLRQLLIQSELGLGVSQQCVVTDAAVPSGRERPDIQIWLEGVPAELRNENEHLFAIIEVKSGTKVKDGGRSFARSEIDAYRYRRLTTFWLADAEVVCRYDITGPDAPIPNPQSWAWAELASDQLFLECFAPLVGERRTLRAMLEGFTRIEVPVGAAVGSTHRREFIESIVTVARLLSRSVADLVNSSLVPDLKTAMEAIAEVEAQYGIAKIDWTHPDEYLAFAGAPEPEDVEAHHAFNAVYTDLIAKLEPWKYALVAEAVNLPAYARRSGLDAAKVSFLKGTKEAKSGRESFVQETATLLFSRLLMIRFSEDHDLLDRYVSNGGLAAFATYARHFRYPFQKLVSEAYENARALYQHLFERKALDWILDRSSPSFGDDILHAMWILARWDFRTVRGDILSGVYDRSLNEGQRKRLGEVYTRPELARYLISACEWDGSQRILDPACGSGTFLVEAFDAILQRAEHAGVTFDDEDAIALLTRLFGLDINEFSATLAKIQILWHVLSVVKGDPSASMAAAIRALHVEGGHDSLDPWGLPMAVEGSLLTGEEGRVNAERRAARDKGSRTLKVSDRRFRDISSDREAYDIVIGNPPYVRVQRFGMSASNEAAYAEVKRKQTDLSVFFVYRALRWWLKPGGRMAFFLPLAITETAYAERIRNIIDEFKIIEIVDLELVGNAAFHGANVVTIALVVEKASPAPEDEVTIVTVTAECLDPVSNTIDMSKARRSAISRTDIRLSRYLGDADITSADSVDDAISESAQADGGAPPTADAAVAETVDPPESSPALEDETDDDDDGGSASNVWLTKVTAEDVSVLRKLSDCPRLATIIAQGFERPLPRPARRAKEIPANENPNKWRRKSIVGQGLEIGGTPPNDAGGTKILRARSVYPEAVEGEPYGFWRPGGTPITQARFYNWADVIDTSRAFVVRKINLQPTFTRHPDDTYLTNTVYILQLAVDFPLHVYSLSRIPGWYVAKTGRMSVVQKYWSTWVPRNLMRMPVPADITDEFRRDLNNVGERLFAADTELARGYEQLKSYAADASKMTPLSKRLDLIANGTLPKPVLIAWPDDDTDWSTAEAKIVGDSVRFVAPTQLFPDLPARTSTGVPCEIEIADPDLRRWVAWLAADCLASDNLPSQKWMSQLPIPVDVGEAIKLLDRLENNEAQAEFNVAMDALDEIVAAALSLDDQQRDYIVNQMRTDPLLSEIRPTWKHRTQRYIA